jgi:hypothetical protein
MISEKRSRKSSSLSSVMSDEVEKKRPKIGEWHDGGSSKNEGSSIKCTPTTK